MRKLWFLFLLTLILFSALHLYAQENEDGEDEGEPVSPPIDTDWGEFPSTLNTRGDKTFVISLGVIIPAVFTGKGIENNKHNLSVGGTGSLSYNYFINPYVFIGAELSGMFVGTIGGNMLYIVPFGAVLGYQFVFGRFELPISLMIGGAPQTYIEKNYFGFFFKPGVSGYFRFDSDWSFGINTLWWMVPQWPKDGRNVLGNLLQITVSARYHF